MRTLQSCVQSGLAGFNLSSWPDFLHADALHIDKGLADHLVSLLRKNIRPIRQKALDQLCAQMPFYFDMQLPKQPFTSKGLHTADKARNFVRLLPVLLLGTTTKSKCTTDMLQWIQLFVGRTSHMHACLRSKLASKCQ